MEFFQDFYCHDQHLLCQENKCIRYKIADKMLRSKKILQRRGCSFFAFIDTKLKHSTKKRISSCHVHHHEVLRCNLCLFHLGDLTTETNIFCQINQLKRF